MDGFSLLSPSSKLPVLFTEVRASPGPLLVVFSRMLLLFNDRIALVVEDIIKVEVAPLSRCFALVNFSRTMDEDDGALSPGFLRLPLDPAPRL